MPDLGPLNVFICWQTILFSIGIALASHGIKTIMDLIIGHYSGADHEKSKIGKDIRKNSKLITGILVPSIPLVVGSLLALFVPLTPDVLVTYVKGLKNGWLVLMFYGATCGVVADYVYNHYKKNFVK